MYTRFVIFGVIFALLVAAIYSSSTHLVFAEIISICDGDLNNKTYFCGLWNSVTNEYSGWKCTRNPTGGQDTCVKAKIVTKDSMPPWLNDALDAAIQEESEGDTDISNDTKVPKGLGGLNNDNGPTINPGEK